MELGANNKLFLMYILFIRLVRSEVVCGYGWFT